MNTPTQTGRVRFAEDLLAMVAGGIHGELHRRADNRGTPYLTQPDDRWADDVTEAVGGVLATESGSRAHRDALIGLAATASEWALALYSTPTPQED